MPELHIPVLPEQVLYYLDCHDTGVYVDATLGDGGHAEKICLALNHGGRLIGIYWDESAIERSRQRLKRFGALVTVVHESYTRLEVVLNELGVPKVDGILLDLGVSTLQLMEPKRGFSYQHEAPLDMRMDRRLSVQAADLVNELPEDELAGIIYRYGEERWARRIAGRIVRRRLKEGPINTSAELVDVIKAAIPAASRRQGGHPARRTFQALRLAVNREINNIETVLPQALRCLNPGGRLCVISYHSLEDRLVKNFLRERAGQCNCSRELPCKCEQEAQLKLLTPRAVKPLPSEVANNPRSRSARLRAASMKEPR